MLNEQHYQKLRRESSKKEKSSFSNIAGIVGLPIEQQVDKLMAQVEHVETSKDIEKGSSNIKEMAKERLQRGYDVTKDFVGENTKKALNALDLRNATVESQDDITEEQPNATAMASPELDQDGDEANKNPNKLN